MPNPNEPFAASTSSRRAARAQVVVVGAGAGGLFTALFLARLGHRVTVIDKGRQPGGMMRSYRRAGVECPVGIHYLGSLDPGQCLHRMLAALDLHDQNPTERLGQDGGPVDRYEFPDGGTFDVPSGVEAFCETLRAQFPDEQSSVLAIQQSLCRADQHMHTLDFVTRDVATDSDSDGPGALGAFARALGCSERLQQVLAMPTALFGVPIDEAPTALHHMVLSSYLRSAHRLRRGGAALVDSMIARLRSLGGNVLTGRAVAQVRVRDRVAIGVTLVDGEAIDADHVVAAVHPKLLLELLPAGAVKPAYRQRIGRLTDTPSAFGLHALVPRTDALAAQRANVFVLRPGAARDDIGFHQLGPSTLPGMLLLSSLEKSHVTDFGPLAADSAARPAGYRELKHARAEALLAEACAVFGGLPGARVIDSYSPLTIREWVSSPDGSAYGVSRGHSQRIQASMLHRTPIAKLHAAGQSALAPGILGTAVSALVAVRGIVGPSALCAGLPGLFL